MLELGPGLWVCEQVSVCVCMCACRCMSVSKSDYLNQDLESDDSPRLLDNATRRRDVTCSSDQDWLLPVTSLCSRLEAEMYQRLSVTKTCITLCPRSPSTGQKKKMLWWQFYGSRNGEQCAAQPPFSSHSLNLLHVHIYICMKGLLCSTLDCGDKHIMLHTETVKQGWGLIMLISIEKPVRPAAARLAWLISFFFFRREGKQNAFPMRDGAYWKLY